MFRAYSSTMDGELRLDGLKSILTKCTGPTALARLRLGKKLPFQISVLVDVIDCI